MAGESEEVCFADGQVGENVCVLCTAGEGTFMTSLVCLSALFHYVITYLQISV